jgi:hypothetical protein
MPREHEAGRSGPYGQRHAAAAWRLGDDIPACGQPQSFSCHSSLQGALVSVRAILCCADHIRLMLLIHILGHGLAFPAAAASGSHTRLRMRCADCRTRGSRSQMGCVGFHEGPEASNADIQPDTQCQSQSSSPLAPGGPVSRSTTFKSLIVQKHPWSLGQPHDAASIRAATAASHSFAARQSCLGSARYSQLSLAKRCRKINSSSQQ